MDYNRNNKNHNINSNNNWSYESKKEYKQKNCITKNIVNTVIMVPQQCVKNCS